MLVVAGLRSGGEQGINDRGAGFIYPSYAADATEFTTKKKGPLDWQRGASKYLERMARVAILDPDKARRREDTGTTRARGKTSALTGKPCHVSTSGGQDIEGLVFVRTGNTGCDTLRGRVSGDERMLQATTPLGSEPAPVQGFDPSGVVAYRTMRPRAASTPKGVAAGVGIFPGHQ